MSERKPKVTYTEIARLEVTPTRNIVISACSQGGYTIAQQVAITESPGKVTNIFMKGAIRLEGLEGLIKLRDAINHTIAVENGEYKEVLPFESVEDDEEWDNIEPEGWE